MKKNSYDKRISLRVTVAVMHKMSTFENIIHEFEGTKLTELQCLL